MDEREIEQLFHDGYAAFGRGDFDAAVAMFSDDFVMVRPGDLGEVRGKEAVRAFYEPDALTDMTLEIGSIEVFGDVLVVSARIAATGRASGIPVSQDSVQVWWMRDGLVIRSEAHTNRAAAFLAAKITDPNAGE